MEVLLGEGVDVEGGLPAVDELALGVDHLWEVGFWEKKFPSGILALEEEDEVAVSGVVAGVASLDEGEGSGEEVLEIREVLLGGLGGGGVGGEDLFADGGRLGNG